MVDDIFQPSSNFQRDAMRGFFEIDEFAVAVKSETAVINT
jgi:hypothetical protein